ncbi:hypothetical protein [Candidatus Poriferisocius sp.]|uniref:hypothetical protein n=1 Tax=Candidatus Poriferisocius sp. TaxID=3101276 RepID=UPI003B528A53
MTINTDFLLRCIGTLEAAHDCGEHFAEATLKLLTDFIADARELAEVIAEPVGG